MADGTFLVSYQSTSTALGAYHLGLNLVVDAANNTAAGIASVTNGSVNPAVDVKLPVHGTVTDMTVMPKNTHHLVVLESSNKLLGRHIEVRLVTSDDWQTGTANVTLFLDTAQGVVQFTTEVKVVKAEQR